MTLCFSGFPSYYPVKKLNITEWPIQVGCTLWHPLTIKHGSGISIDESPFIDGPSGISPAIFDDTGDYGRLLHFGFVCWLQLHSIARKFQLCYLCIYISEPRQGEFCVVILGICQFWNDHHNISQPSNPLGYSRYSDVEVCMMSLVIACYSGSFSRKPGVQWDQDPSNFCKFAAEFHDIHQASSLCQRIIQLECGRRVSCYINIYLPSLLRMKASFESKRQRSSDEFPAPPTPVAV